MVSAPQRNTHVKKGDEVVVITGNHRGKVGKILEVIVKKNQVLVEGIRLTKRHLKKSQDRPQGGTVEKEGPIHISNVALTSKYKKGAMKASGSKTKEAKAKKTKTKDK